MTYDTLLGYLDGSMRYADSPSTIYVASIKGHPGFVKIGMCQLHFRNQRRADPFIETILYESCMDEELQTMVGDLPRSEAWLIEQYIHQLLTSHRELIPELEEIKWSGRYETFRFSTEGLHQFLLWLEGEVNSLVCRGSDALEQMLDQLVCSSAERELYERLKAQWDADRKRRMAMIKKRKVAA